MTNVTEEEQGELEAADAERDDDEEVGDRTAADDEVFVCLACGKTSRTKYGFDGTADPGWDESCMLNCQKFKKDQVVYQGRKLRRILPFSKREYSVLMASLVATSIEPTGNYFAILDDTASKLLVRFKKEQELAEGESLAE